jgi:integrase
MTYTELETLILDDYRIARRRSLRSLESARLPHLRAFFKTRTVIDSTAIRAYIARRLNVQHAAPASINRELAALRRMHTLASLPWPRVTFLRESSPREGFVTPAAFESIRAALPQYLRDPISFLFLSSWRVSEMRGLTWSEVFFDEPKAFRVASDGGGLCCGGTTANVVRDSSRIHLSASRSKNGRARVLPLRGELRAIILRALARRSPHSDLVFHHGPCAAPLADFRRAWKSAVARAAKDGGINSALLIHDLRRSAIRNFVRAGVRESVAMALSGHRTRSVFDRYNITDNADLVSAVEAICPLSN